MGNPYRKWLPERKKKPKNNSEKQPSTSTTNEGRPSISSALGRVFGRPIADLNRTYTVLEKLGEGDSSVTRLVKDKCGNRFACKSIVLDRLVQPELIRREVEVLHHLAGHPNIVSLREVIEDEKAVHLVMELGKGGMLITKRRHLFVSPGPKQSAFKKLTKSYKPYTPKEAREIFRHIATAIRDCHEMGVMHRNLKPENLVFSTKRKDSPVKVIGFGLSTFFTPGEKFEESIGSPPYVAPEVTKAGELYGPKADVYSAGMILFLLLCGVPPSGEVTVEHLREALKSHNYSNYAPRPWDKIPPSAKDLLQSMLEEDQELRISSVDIFSHPWMQAGTFVSHAPREITIIKRMLQFKEMPKFKRVAIKVIVTNLLVEETKGLKKIYESFKDVDPDDDIPFEEGLTSDELKDGLHKWGGVHFSSSEMNDFIDPIDVDGNWIIDEAEFIAATMHLGRIENCGRIYKAFQYFDINGDGCITTDDLEQALQKFNIADMKIDEIIKEVFGEQDRQICYSEFEGMMKKGNYY